MTSEMAHKRVSLRGSALFKLTSPERLADILCITPADLDRLVRRGDGNYAVWVNKESGRRIEEPKPDLKALHARIARLLAQIETPEYLHSGIKKRSYVTNAAGHSVQGGAIKLDVKKFFPSARAVQVHEFFVTMMEYPIDVASRMTTLLTIDGHLPTGGNASSILSFWAYKPMFDELAELAEAHGCKFTVYVDDITMSGKGATRSLQQKARKIIGRYHLKAHKNKVFSPRQPRVVTGVAITARGQELPNRRAMAIAKTSAEIAGAETDQQRLDLLPSLVGRVSEAAEIDPAWKSPKAAVVAMRQEIRRRMRTA